MRNALNRTLIALAAVALFVGSLIAQTANRTPSADAMLKAEPAEVVFTEAYADTRSEMEVKLTNTSERQIEILSAKGSCGCTTTGLDKKVLEPGESTSMQVAFRGARSQAGQTIEKKVTVTLKDPAGASINIPVRATVTAAIMIDPAVLRLTEVELGSEWDREVHLRSTDGQSFAITSVSTAGDVASATPAATEPGLEQTVAVKIKVPEDVGHKTAGFGKVSIKTTHPKDNSLDVAVNWRLAEPVIFSPSYLNLGSAPVGQIINRTLIVQPRKRDKFENLTFRSDNPMITVKAAPHPSREHMWNLALTVAPELAGKPVYANLLIDTHVEPEGEVRVRVSGRALPNRALSAKDKAAMEKQLEADRAKADAKKAAIEAQDFNPKAETANEKKASATSEKKAEPTNGKKGD